MSQSAWSPLAYIRSGLIHDAREDMRPEKLTIASLGRFWDYGSNPKILLIETVFDTDNILKVKDVNGNLT